VIGARFSLGWSALLALSALMAGCSGSALDRAGGTAGNAVRVIAMAQPNDGVPAQAQAWADEVGRLSHGTLRVEFKQGWRKGDPEAERGILADVGHDKVDMAWVGARVFDRVGILRLRPLVAPLLIDSQALQARVFSGGIAATMVKGVHVGRTVAVGVLPGPMRKVLGVSHPFLSPEDYAGQVVGMQDGGVAQDTLQALGATPRPMPAGASLDGLDGYEQQLDSIWGDHFELSARFVTGNVNLWPRPLVLVASRHLLASLTSRQRDALRHAVRTSIGAAIDAARSEDEATVPELCNGGIAFPLATVRQMHELQDAVQPVYDELRADPHTSATLDAIVTLKAHIGTGPDSTSCPRVSTGPRLSSASIPDGTYVTTLTRDDVQGCQDTESEAGYDQTLLELQLSNGDITQYEQLGGAGGTRRLGWVGRYRVFRDRLELTEASTGATMTTLWTYHLDRLTLTDMRNGRCGDDIVWTTHPWILSKGARKVAR
jgi:TRAP-type C4-dicarboxylate transport system substrate-binding protein